MIGQAIVVLADAARARIFTLENKPGRAGRPEPTLVERVDLVNPGRRLRPSEQLSDTRPGSRRASAGPGHAVDDHRDAHMNETDRRFARDIIGAADEVATAHARARLLLVAPPRLVGHLRRHARHTRRTVHYVTLDLSTMTPSKALDHLTHHGYLRSLSNES